MHCLDGIGNAPVLSQVRFSLVGMIMALNNDNIDKDKPTKSLIWLRNNFHAQERQKLPNETKTHLRK
jgi:hypothetical protein